MDGHVVTEGTMLSFTADTKENHGIHLGKCIIQPTFYPNTSNAFGPAVFWIKTRYLVRGQQCLLYIRVLL
jgi:hypothetical protein